MAKERTIATIARITGFLMLGATVFHAILGGAEVMTAIKLGDIRVSMADTVRIIWIYSTIMLLLTAIWIFFLVSELRQLKRKAWWQGVFIGLGYVVGSVGCMVTIGVYAHLVAFMLIGLFLLVPLIIWTRSFRSPSH